MYVPKRPMYTSKRILMETPSKETYVCTNVERKIYIKSFYVYIKETCKRDLLAHSHTWRVTRVCVAVCCSVLQCVVAVCCGMLHCVDLPADLHIWGPHMSALQCVAVCCSVLQCVDLRAHLHT